MKFRIRFMAIALILCISLSLIGCSSKSSNNKPLSKIKSVSNNSASKNSSEGDKINFKDKEAISENKNEVKVQDSNTNTEKPKTAQAAQSKTKENQNPPNKETSPDSKPSNTKSSTRTIIISGMMCSVCVEHIRDALSSIPNVKVISVIIGKAQVTLEGDVSDDTLKNAVIHAGDDAGYTVISIS